MAYCEFCKDEFEPSNKQRFCSKSCASKNTVANRTDNWRADNSGKNNGMYGVSLKHPNSLANLTKGRDAIRGTKQTIESNNKRSEKLTGIKRSKETIAKTKETKIALGIWRKPDDPFYESYKKYKRKVYYWTNRQDTNTLPNSDKRGRGINDYHLDHKYSIYEGFINDIAPKIIGNINNLEFIKSRLNTRKGTACSITKEELHNGV